MKKLLTAFVAAVALCSCGSTSHYVGGTIQEKTIYITTGRLGVIGDLKTELRNHGWKIYGKPQKTLEQQNQDKAVTYIGNARYSLNWEYRTRDRHILTWKPILDLSLSLIDNTTGEETLTYEAKRTEQGKCFSEFMQLLDENSAK